MSASWHKDAWHYFDKAIGLNQLPHAILLAAKAGCLHEQFAGELTQALLCPNAKNGPACNNCRSCRLFLAQSHPEALIIKQKEGKTQIGIEQIRDMQHFMGLSKSISQRRVVLILGADQMSLEASNACLKSLEEPLADTVLLLYSESSASLLQTIRSRCQTLALSKPNQVQSQAYLKESFPNHADADIKQVLAYAQFTPELAARWLMQDSNNTKVPTALNLAVLQTLDTRLAAIIDGKESLQSLSVWLEKINRISLADLFIQFWQSHLKSNVLGLEQETEIFPKSLKLKEKQTRDMNEEWRTLDKLQQWRSQATHPLNPRLAIENVLSFIK